MPVGKGIKRQKPTFQQVLAQLNPLAWQAGTSWAWNTKVPFWTGSGEMEALCELFFDNLATLLGVTGSAVGHIGYGIVGAGWRNWGPQGPGTPYNVQIAKEWEDIYFKWNIPACGFALLFGNVWFAWLATRLATKENRLDVTAQPYGMNTTVIYITLYAMTLPALEAAHDKFMPACEWKDGAGTCTEAMIVDAAKKAADYGWKVSVGVNFIIGIFEIAGCFLGEFLRWLLPTAAIYVPLAGVGFVWLAFSPMISIAQEPIMCFLPLIVVLIGFFGNVRYPLFGKVTFPIAVLAIGISVISGWAGGCEHSTDNYIAMDYAGTQFKSVADFYNGGKKRCTGTDGNAAKLAWETYAGQGGVLGGFGKGMDGLGDGIMKDWISGALLFGMIGFLGTMTCVESAEAAGDAYPMAEVMVVDGIGTCMGSIFGGIYGTTVYIGHPVHKALGAKIGYSIVNGVLYLILLSTGIFAWLYNVIPGCANGAILVFVGLLLSRQAFEESPARHYPCILLGMMPFICNMMSLESGGNHSTNMGVQMMAPAGGVVFGMGMCAIACFAIDRKFEEACILSFLAIFASLFGIFASHNAVIDMNGVRGSDHQTLGIYTNKDDAFQGWRWSVAWTMCLVYFAAHIPFQKGNKMAVLQSIPPRIEDDDADPYDESVN
jgi:AGZA family xanthine/uracil permease-like MFS transporter